MTKQGSLQSDREVTDFWDSQSAIASPCRSATGCESNLPMQQSSRIRLDLEDLRCFEVVEQQFKHWGIAFRNAIALQPSNPAYQTRSGSTLLMGAPRNGWLEVNFSQTVKTFCCYVTSSRRMLLSVYDNQDELLVRHSLDEPNLAGFGSEIPPNAQLSVEESNISRITFYAFDGQLTITDLSFSFKVSGVRC